MLIPFATTYRCETGFSTLVTLKTKARNRLNVEHDMRCALSETEPNVVKLANAKQFQPSHQLTPRFTYLHITLLY